MARPDRQLDHDQRPRACLAFDEPEPGRLLLRVPLHSGEEVSDVFVDETPTRVAVEVLVGGAPTHPPTTIGDVEVYLGRALAGRAVQDLVADRAVARIDTRPQACGAREP